MRNELRRSARLAAHAVQAGSDLARDAWRDVGPVLALSTVAGAAVFVGDHAALPHAAGQALHLAGWLAVALLFAPKLGALFRLALGGPALRELGAGGLQWKQLEWRLLATTVALAGFAMLVAVTLLLIVMAVLTVLRPLGVVVLGPFGPLGIGFLLTAPLFLALIVAIMAGLTRLAVTLPAEVAETRPRFARGWFVTRGETVAAGLTGAAVFLMPLLGVTALQIALDALQAGDGAGFGGRGWSLAEAVGAGAVLAGLVEFLCAPLCVGALAELFIVLAPAPAEIAAPSSAPSEDQAAAASSEAEILPENPSEDGAPGPETPSDQAAPAPETEAVEPPQPRPRLRLVHNVEEIAWPPLAPTSGAREAEGGYAAESQEP